MHHCIQCTVLQMLGTFPTRNFQRLLFHLGTSQQCNIPANGPATSQFCHSNSTRPSYPQHSAPQSCLRRLRRHILTFRKLHLGKLHIWEVAIGKMPLRKYLTPIHRIMTKRTLYCIIFSMVYEKGCCVRTVVKLPWFQTNGIFYRKESRRLGSCIHNLRNSSEVWEYNSSFSCLNWRNGG